MTSHMGDVDLLQIVLDRLVQGEEQAAELTARLAWQSGTPLTEIYETLRRGIYAPAAAGHDDNDAIDRHELDHRLARLAARLPSSLDGPVDPRVVVLSTERRGLPACLLHLFAERGMRAAEIELAVLSQHHRAHPHAAMPFPTVRYVVADCSGADPAQVREEVDELRALHLADAQRDVIVLTDVETTVLIDKELSMSAVTTLAELLRVTGARTENPLTARECEVLQKVAVGSTNAQVAHGLGISIGTVKTYLERAQEKTQARDRASTVAVALRNGWL